MACLRPLAWLPAALRPRGSCVLCASRVGVAASGRGASRGGRVSRFTNIDGKKTRTPSKIQTHLYRGGPDGYVPRGTRVDLQVVASRWERRTGAPLMSHRQTVVPGRVQVEYEAVDGHYFWRHRKPRWLE